MLVNCLTRENIAKEANLNTREELICTLLALQTELFLRNSSAPSDLSLDGWMWQTSDDNVTEQVILHVATPEDSSWSWSYELHINVKTSKALLFRIAKENPNHQKPWLYATIEDYKEENRLLTHAFQLLL